MAFPHLERLPQVCSILCHTLLSYSLGRLGENLCLESNICHAIWLTHLRASISPALGDSCTKSLKRNFVYWAHIHPMLIDTLQSSFRPCPWSTPSRGVGESRITP
jgi:hypothetical protein